MKTSHPGIYALDEETDLSEPTISAMVSSLDEARRSHSRKAVLEQIARFIPTMGGAVRPVSAA